MNFYGSCVRLFETDIKKIKDFILNLTNEEWDEWNHRQKSFDVHRKTKTFPLRWSEFEENIVKVNIKNEHQKINELINPIIERLEYHYNGICVNIMFAKLLAKEKIPCHVDLGLLTLIHRCHLPVQTNQDIMFLIDDNQFFLKEGYVYELNNTQSHCVENFSDQDRTHLIIDILPHTSNIEVKFISD